MSRLERLLLAASRLADRCDTADETTDIVRCILARADRRGFNVPMIDAPDAQTIVDPALGDEAIAADDQRAHNLCQFTHTIAQQCEGAADIGRVVFALVDELRTVLDGMTGTEADRAYLE